MDGMEHLKVQIEKWIDQSHQFLVQLLPYVQQIPPLQLYVAVAVLASTVILLLLGKFTLLRWDDIVILPRSSSIWRCLPPRTGLFLILSFCSAVPLLKRKKSNTIVLSGLSGSGKTVIFYQVIAEPLLFEDDIITALRTLILV